MVSGATVAGPYVTTTVAYVTSVAGNVTTAVCAVTGGHWRNDQVAVVGVSVPELRLAALAPVLTDPVHAPKRGEDAEVDQQVSGQGEDPPSARWQRVQFRFRRASPSITSAVNMHPSGCM